MKNKVLCLLQLPPPVHGASMVNVSIRDSKYINAKIDAKYIDISPANDMTDLGKLSLNKIALTFIIIIKCIYNFLRFKPDLVYITLSPHGFAFWKDALILQMLKLLGAKIVVHLHGKGIKSEVSKSKFKLSVYKKVFKRINVIHLSKSLFSDVDTVFDNTMLLTEVNNGVKTPTYEKKPLVSIPTFLYLSNLVPTKGADTLINAINKLDDKYQGEFKVKVVGKISNKEFYDKLVNSVDIRFKNSIEFTGPLYGDDKHKAFMDSDVFVLPTRFKNECFPLSILEAMSFGLPVLSTYEGAIPDIIDDGINGGLFESSNSNELSEMMSNYIDNRHLIIEHGINSNSKFKEKYTIEAFELSFVKVLKLCLS